MSDYQPLYDVSDIPGNSAPPPPGAAWTPDGGGQDAAPAAPFDAEPAGLMLDYGGAPVDDAARDQRIAAIGNRFLAAKNALEYDDNAASSVAALQDTADARNAAILKATGVTLENPLNGGYTAEALDRVHQDWSLWADADGRVDTSVQGQRVRLNQIALQIWQGKLDTLSQQFPQHSDIIGASRPIALDARQMADGWAARAQAGEPGLDATTNLLTGFAGGMAGFFRDPVNVATLLLGGGEARAVSTVGRMAAAAVRLGLANAGAQALAEPGVQAWRAERGHASGVAPALQDIGAAFLFGAIPGAGIEGAKAMLGAGRGLAAAGGAAPAQGFDLLDRAMGGDAAALGELANGPLAAHAPELGALHDAVEADRLILGHETPHVEALDATVSQALGRAEDPAQPLPEMPLPAGDGASLAPDQIAQARIDALAPEARAMVDSGAADAQSALATAARVTDPAEQSAVLAEAAATNPRSAQEAAQAVTDAMDARATPQAQAHLLGADEASSTIERPAVSRETEAAQRAQIEDLRSALDAPAAEGQRAEAPADLLDMAPTEDGRIVPQAQALAAEPRENVLANIIQLCEV